jgi:hypothetical protein
MYLSEELQSKWGPVLDHEDLGAISDPHKRACTAILLENQETALREASGAGAGQFLTEATPTNATGAGIDNFDPVLISLVRRAMPNLIAYDICGVQPMTGPTGLIFAMRANYTTQLNDEALFNEANTSFSATGTKGFPDTGTNVHTESDSLLATAETGNGMSTTSAESLGSASGEIAEMGFNIDKVTVTALSRALKAEYTVELAQDLKAVHGLDAETELANILSAEILAEINREIVRTINKTAVDGAQDNTANPHQFDLDVDANGRWSVERFKGLMFQLEREANAIARATRRGKGNIIICSSDVASALSMAGSLDHAPALKDNLNVDDTGNTFAGVLNGRFKVYIDPYFSSDTGLQYATVGYKGSSAYDAGLFYCPYVPLQMVRAVGENNFQPKIGFKTRYGLVANPFATTNQLGVVKTHGATPGTDVLDGDRNIYYRSMVVKNLM